MTLNLPGLHEAVWVVYSPDGTGNEICIHTDPLTGVIMLQGLGFAHYEHVKYPLFIISMRCFDQSTMSKHEDIGHLRCILTWLILSIGTCWYILQPFSLRKCLSSITKGFRLHLCRIVLCLVTLVFYKHSLWGVPSTSHLS